MSGLKPSLLSSDNRIEISINNLVDLDTVVEFDSLCILVDFTQGAGTWHRRVWKNGGKEFELSELSVRQEDAENVSECPAALILPLKFPGDGEFVSPIPVHHRSAVGGYLLLYRRSENTPWVNRE